MADHNYKEVIKKCLKLTSNKLTAEELFKAFQSTCYDTLSLFQSVTLLIDNKENFEKYRDEYKLLEFTYDKYSAFVKLIEFIGETKNVAKTVNVKNQVSGGNTSLVDQKPLNSYVPCYTKIPEKKQTNFNCVSVNRQQTLWNFDEFLDFLPIKSKTAIYVPYSSQERMVCNELLKCLVGIKGDLIKPNHVDDTVYEFTISSNIYETLRDLTHEVTPIGNYYAQIQAFTQFAATPDKGQILNAFSGALRKVLSDYYMSVGQLETMQKKKQLNLQKMIYFLRPILKSMEKISNIVIQVQNENLRGGAVLTLLFDRVTTESGDTDTQKVFKYLTKTTVLPYFEMLKLWISKGVIYDPGREFFIIDNQTDKSNEIYQSAYWDSRYTIDRKRIPKHFNTMADKILRTGKYLNVIRECGMPLRIEEHINFDNIHLEQNYVNVINEAYNFASSLLLKLIIEEYDLFGRFQSVKRYFLLQQGDFIAQFMDTCEQELSKNIEKVIPMKLENLLELTLRLSSAKHDKYQDDLKTCLLPYGILTQMTKLLSNKSKTDTEDISELTGIECFTFSYQVQWPMSIVFNHVSVVAKYQMIFRELFYVKHVERLLYRLWTVCNNVHKSDRHIVEMYRSAFILRQRMMNAIQNIEYYLMIEVIEPSWHIFYEKLKKVKNIDDVLMYHQEFLDHCLKNCMLTDPDLLKLIIQICNICIEFCEFIYIECERKLINTFQQKIDLFSTKFKTKILALLRYINDVSAQNPSETKFLNLVHRINFNSFYTDHMESQ